jgi:hypothetical protein
LQRERIAAEYRVRDRDVVAVEDHPLDVIFKKQALCVEVCAGLQAGVSGCAELPDARVYEILLLGGAHRRDELGLLADEAFLLSVKGAICG